MEHCLSQPVHADTKSSEPHPSLIRTDALRSAGCRSGWRSTVLAVIVVFAYAVQVEAEPLPVGTRVLFDKVYASNPALSQWIEGEITGYVPAQNYYKIRSTSGTVYTISNDPRWIRPAGGNGPSIAPGQGPMTPAGPTPLQPASPQVPSVPAGRFTPGTRVQFDRGEATIASNGRWDSGIIVARVANNRYTIRNDNGVIYTIQD